MNAASSRWGSKACCVMRTSISAPAHRRQERDFIAIGYRAGQIVCHALVEDQPGSCCGHRLAQQRLLARQPVLKVTEGMHIAGQRDLYQVCRRHVTELAQKYKPDHLPSGDSQE
jgi:hypothetical protein